MGFGLLWSYLLLLLIWSKLSHIALKDIVNKIWGACTVSIVVSQRWVILAWRCVLVLQLDYNTPSSSKASDFTPDAGSAARHLLSPLGDSCCTVYWLPGTIGFPSLQGFQQSLATVSPLRSSLCSIPLSGCYGLRLQVWGIIVEQILSMPVTFHSGSRNCIFPYNFCAVSISLRMQI